MPIEYVVEIAQYWEAIIATSALVASFISLRRDKRSRQMDMLHDVFRNIGDLNTRLAFDYDPSDKNKKQKYQDGNIILQEKFKEYDYLCYLINRKKVNEQDAYELGGRDIIGFFKNNADKVGDNQYSDIESVVERWEDYPPTSIPNRCVLWMKKTIRPLSRDTPNNEADEEESESSDDEESSKKEVENTNT